MRSGIRFRVGPFWASHTFTPTPRRVGSRPRWMCVVDRIAWVALAGVAVLLVVGVAFS